MTAQRRFLADTNLVSFALMHKMGHLKKQRDIDAAVWYEAITRDTKAILSFATVAELRRWINSIKDQAERDRIAKVVVPCIESSYRIQSNDAIAESWAMIAKEAKARGRMSKPSPLGSQINDIWIAATAHASNLTLLTCDAGFGWMADIGVGVLVYSGDKRAGGAETPLEL